MATKKQNPAAAIAAQAITKAQAKFTEIGDGLTVVAKAAGADPLPVGGVETAPKSGMGLGVVKKSGGAWNVDPSKIMIEEGWNIRFDMGDIDALATSIKSNLSRDPESGGLIHPIGVRRLPAEDVLSQGGKYNFAVVRGHRRTTAILQLLKAGTEFPFGVPAKILDKAQSLRDATLEMFVENDQKPLLPLEEAAAFKRLQDGDPSAEPPVPGMTIREIVKETGRSDHHVIATLALLDADDSVTEALKTGAIGKTTARAIAKDARGDKAKQKALVDLAKNAGQGKGKTAVKDALHKAKTDKAAAKGKQLKIRALSDQQLSALGAASAAKLAELLKVNDLAEEDLPDLAADADKLGLMFQFGVLQALKAAAGMKIDLGS